MPERIVPKFSVRDRRPQNRIGLIAAKASMLSALVMMFLSPFAGAQVLVDKSVTFPQLRPASWAETSPAQEVVFDVRAPGYVTVKIWVDPYQACMRVSYSSVVFKWGSERTPFEKTLRSTSVQNGKPVLDYIEGVPIYHETVYQAYRPFLGVRATLYPAVQMNANTQFRQVVRLVVEYSATPPSGVAPGPDPGTGSSGGSSGGSGATNTGGVSSDVTEVAWNASAYSQGWRGKNGQQMKVRCPAGGTLVRVYGTDTYTDDSSICTAAVHAGFITAAQGGTVTIQIAPGAASYQGTTRNGIQTRGYTSFSGSFRFVGTGSTHGGGSAGSGSGSGGGGTSSGGGGSSGGSAATMTLRTEVRKAKVNETMTIPVWLDGASGISNMNFNVSYDSSVVRVSGVTKGSFFTSRTLVESNPGEKGIVRFGFADRTDLSGTGPVAQITYQVIGKAGDRSPIRLQVSTASGSAGTKPVVKTVDGEIQVLGAGGGDKGDSNGNGTPDAGDALEALKMSVRLVAVKMICDMDNDGQVTSTDARLILEKVVGR